MTRNILIVSAAEVECEQIFNTAEAVYDHRKSFNSKIFFALMMIRFHDRNENLQAKFDENLLIEKDLTYQNIEKKMKKRVNELKDVYNKLYINDDNENDVENDTTTRVSTAIRY
jgi:hypothetical protein